MPPADAPRLAVKGAVVPTDKALIMGVLNASPESFSGDGRPLGVDEINEHASALIDDGADILDVGGQSARTNQAELDALEEIDRILPVLEFVASKHPDTIISIDAYRPRVVEAALKAGAGVVNDVSGLLYPEVAQLCVDHGAALVLMHTRARPKARLQDPELYGSADDGVVSDVVGFLREGLARAADLGLDPEATIVDPGPDFTKTPHQTLRLMQGIDQVRALGRPVLMALSRKDFLGAIIGKPPAGRDAATHAAVALLGSAPGSIVRVHDVAAARDVLATANALAGRNDIDPGFLLTDALRYQTPS
ncbi:MAG: dihydropteroate synthase [Aeromicrobium sp.]